ncbi:MAG: hypothetical protein WC879_16530 [Melioribacteraceae bacterium]
MDAAINYLLRDSGALKSTIDLNRTGMNEGGFSDESYISFIGAIEDLNTKETAQEKAVKDAGDKTAAQNEIVAGTQKLISDVKAAAKSAYGRDKRNLSMFKIGEDITKSVKSLIPLCSYMIEQVQERKAVLLKNGLKQTKIDALIATPAQLKTADDVQESAKKIQKSKTLERDAAAKELKEQIFKIRNFAKACFSGKPEILVQFNPIPKGRGGAGGEEEENPPANTETPKGN